MRDAGFESVPVHVAILDKGQRSVKRAEFRFGEASSR